jgi:glycosyltransferase involved in cell wall biosynthesis
MRLTIALGSRPYDGPWGGGNRFIAALREALAGAGHEVVYDLRRRDLDIILLTDPRVRSPNVCFGAGDIVRYRSFVNPRAIVIHRVNECDERKQEKFINARLLRANYCADATVFVGEWLTRLPLWRERLHKPYYVIRNGSDERIFNAEGFAPWDGKGPLKLVTHHWGYHPMKGFDVYAALDRMLADSLWQGRIDFTYIGNLPRQFTFTNATYIAPLDGSELAAALKRHHAYCTGSINEPGGNHQNEGALCGLPLLYRNSGCLPEYCIGYGVMFDGPADLAEKIQYLIVNYQRLVPKMAHWPHRASRMCAEWIELFERLVAQREKLLESRKQHSNFLRALAAQYQY